LVGRRYRDSTVKAVADELHLDWDTVKELDKQYMAEQLRRAAQRPAWEPVRSLRRHSLSMIESIERARTE